MAAFTLRDFLNACPEMANFAPSEFICKAASGNIITIKNFQYEVRTCCFQYSKEKNFSDFVSKNNLDNHQATSVQENKFYVFSQPAGLSENGVYYLIALRILDSVSE